MSIYIITDLRSFFHRFVFPNIMHFLLGMSEGPKVISDCCRQLFQGLGFPVVLNFTFLGSGFLLFGLSFGQWREIRCLTSLIYCCMSVLERNYLLCLK